MVKASRLQKPRIQWILAAKTLTRLMIDPQDTRQLARLTVALSGRSQADLYIRFKKSAVGARILSQRIDLHGFLNDPAYLAALPENSLGQHILAYMSQNHLSVEHLKSLTQDATDRLGKGGAKVALFADRMRDLHNVYHVLTGYGRDEFGEMFVLAFSYPQQRVRSFAVIALTASLNFSLRLLWRGIWPAGILSTTMAAFRAGAQSAWLPGEDIEAMLAEDIQALRQRLNIPEPVAYHRLLATLRAKTEWQAGLFFARPSTIKVGA
jgi:ubiquinone biosynthesis protein COQ4